jgi:hypothetical protein
MQFKIQDGTTKESEPSLCGTCRWATIVQGQRLRDRIVECGRLSAEGGDRITFPVSRCSSYSDRRHPTVREMEEIAWVLRTDPRRHQIGFVRSKELKPQDRYRLSDDEW